MSDNEKKQDGKKSHNEKHQNEKSSANNIGHALTTAGEVVSGALSAAGEVASDALDTAGEVAGTALIATGKMAGSALSTAGNAIGNAASKASQTVQNVQHKNRTGDEEIDEVLDEQDQETDEFAREFIKKCLRLKSVNINREQFLRAELAKKHISEDRIEEAVNDRPAAAGIPESVIDQIAIESIKLEVRHSTEISIVAGIPGGWSMAATIPADVLQYYAYAFRIMQKLAYLYGWQSFLDDCDEIDDETMSVLASFLGTMMGVAGASNALLVFAANTAAPAVAKRVTAMALTKTTWYPVMKKLLSYIGIKITKSTVGNAAGKAIPLLGGAISGGMTYTSLNHESERLMKQLKKLPQASPDMEAEAEIFFEEDYETVMEEISEELGEDVEPEIMTAD